MAKTYYFRWVGVRDGKPFTGMPRGPYTAPEDLIDDGGVMVLDPTARDEIERMRGDLENYSGCSGLHLQKTEITDGGDCGEWQPTACAETGAGAARALDAMSGKIISIPAKEHERLRKIAAAAT